MKPFGEAGIKLKNSEYYVNAPSDFARENLFYTELGGHYFLNRHYLVSRQITNFRFYVFHYVLHGEMLLVAGGKEYLLHENDLAIVDTSRAHLYASCRDDTEFLFMRFQGNHSKAMVQRLFQYGRVFSPPYINRTHQALLDIVSGFLEQKPLYEETISSHIHTLLCDLLTLRYTTKRGQSVIDEAIHYIESNYHLPITVAGLAGRACLNTSYFSQKFKKQTGLTPKQYLMKTRMNAAKILLQNTSWNIREIAERTGFPSDAYFSSYFHTCFQRTPIQYRCLGKFGD